MNWIIFLYALEIGQMSSQATIINDLYPGYHKDSGYYISLEPEFVLWETLHIKGQALTHMTGFDSDIFRVEKINFNRYGLDIFMQYKMFTIGYYHICQHPVETEHSEVMYGTKNNVLQSETRIYFRISGKL